MSNYSTNEIMFSCQEDLLYKTDSHYGNVFDFIQSYYRTNGNEALAEQNFSHDNWNLIYGWIAQFSPKTMEELPLFGHHSLHPIRFMMFFIMRNPKVGTIFLPFVYIAFIIEAMQATKLNRHGIREIPTSGKLQAYFTLRTFYRRKVLGAATFGKLFAYLVNCSIGGLDRAIRIYFAEGHRVRNAYFYNRALRPEGSLE
jgi:hypothetical protein